MRTLTLALAASSMLAAVPAIAAPGDGKGNAYGHDPKVCLVTFGTPEERAGQADADAVKAQYLPLRIAMTKEAASDDVSDIYGYDADLVGVSGVDFVYPNADGTEATCEYLDNIDGDNDDDDSDD